MVDEEKNALRGIWVILDRYKRHRIRIVIGLLIMTFFGLHVGKWVEWGFIHKLDSFAYDLRLLFTMPKTQDERIVIVDIDEKSLGAEGQWPWNRDKLALLMDVLFEHYEIDLAAFDVVFAEPDKTSSLETLDRLAKHELKDDISFIERIKALRPTLDHDQVFAESLKDRAVILGYYFQELNSSGERIKTGRLPRPAFQAGQFSGRRIHFPQAQGYGANLAVLQDNAYSAGHFNSATDEDGVVRRVPALYEFDDRYFESLSLAVVKAVTGVETLRAGYPPESRAGNLYSQLEWLELGERRIPVDDNLRILVPYRGPQGSFPYVSATDVLNKKVDKSVLSQNIILIGTTAPGLLDLRATPVASVYPGVEIHANLISGILDQSVMENPAFTLGAEFIVLIVAGLAIVLTFPLLSPALSAVWTACVLLIIIGVNIYTWQSGNLVLPLAATLLSVVILFVFDMSFGYFVESRGKRQLAGLFGQYVPPELVDEMSTDPQAFSLEGESREMTVLFSDVRSFTTISEGLDSKELSRLMNAFLTPMTRIIHDNRGTIDKYMGDAIMAFWGAPIRDSEHPRRALKAGMEMIAKLHEMQPEFQAQGWPEIRIGVDLNTGEMSVGNMGSEFRMAYTVMGDAVNLGSRLEGLTKGYGVQVIASESTRKAVPEYTYRELDRVRVKGKDKPVTIYEPVGFTSELSKEVKKEIRLYHDALKLFRSQSWDMAEIQFLNLSKMSPDQMLYAVYIARTAHYRSNPPGERWDGVWTHTSK